MMLKLFTILVFMMSLSVFAGSGVGNGGVSLVCRNLKGEILGAQVLDMYEGEVLYNRRYEDQNSSSDFLIKKAMKILSKFPFFAKSVQKEMDIIKSIIVYVPQGNVLEDTEDSFPTVRRLGCDFEQLANYTNDGQLLIAEEIFDRLDKLNEAALFLHEALYAAIRKKKDLKSSQLIRKLNAYLLATDTDERVIEQIIRSFNFAGAPGEISNVIKDPVHPGTNLPLRFDDWNKENGICNLLGYENAIPHSAQFNRVAPRALMIDGYGNIERLKENVAVVTQITCQNKIENRLNYMLMTVSHPIDPKTGHFLSFDDWSKEDGICVLLGYSRSVPLSTVLQAIGPQVLAIARDGSVERMMTNVPRITGTICIANL